MTEPTYNFDPHAIAADGDRNNGGQYAITTRGGRILEGEERRLACVAISLDTILQAALIAMREVEKVNNGLSPTQKAIAEFMVEIIEILGDSMEELGYEKTAFQKET